MTHEERLNAIKDMNLTEAQERLAEVEDRLNEDDGPARWFAEGRKERRVLLAHLESLDKATVKRHVAITRNDIDFIAELALSSEYKDYVARGEDLAVRLRHMYDEQEAIGMRAREGGAVEIERKGRY